MSNDRELYNLKIGEDVLVSSSSAFVEDCIYKVSRLTRTRVCIQLNEKCEQQFNKETGRATGSSIYCQTFIRIPKKEDYENIKFKIKVNKILRTLRIIKDSIMQNKIKREDIEIIYKYIQLIKECLNKPTE